MLPFFIVLKISFAEADVAIPPYTEIYTYAEQKLQLLLNLGNYAMLATTSCTSPPTSAR
jgi:putrescine transport system permease protein